MRELPPRTYRINARAEQRWLPFGVSHPAKMAPHLARDLFLRYTLPGQTVLDPFGGRGTSLVGVMLGRNVILNELEPPFVAYIRQNYEHLQRHTLPGVELGWADIHQGDSRKLGYLPDAGGVAACVSSPPYADALKGQDENARARKFERWQRGEFQYDRPDLFTSERNQGSAGMYRGGYSTDPANIGNLPHVDCAISSPPYGDVASRDRSDEPYCQALDPVLKAKYGAGDTNRHVDGYGHSVGQIGDLPHAAITSPPYAEATTYQQAGAGGEHWELLRAGFTPAQIAEMRRNSDPRVTQTRRDAGYSRAVENIGNLPHGGVVHAAVSSPPFGTSTPNPLGRAAFRDGGVNLDGGRLQPGDYSDYGESEGQLGKEEGETYARACLAVYRECYRVVHPGGVLVLVTGNYVREGKVVDLAADTLALAHAAGWTPLERWRHEKATVSFWRRLHHRQGRPVVTHEDVLVFCKGPAPAWEFAELPPTHYAPASLEEARGVVAVSEAIGMLPLLEPEP